MLVISKAQYEALKSTDSERYYEALASFFRLRLPQLTSRYQDEALVPYVGRAVRSGRSLGLRTKEGLTSYVGFALAAGEGFLTNDAVSHFLTLPGTPPDRKMRRLAEIINDRA